MVLFFFFWRGRKKGRDFSKSDADLKMNVGGKRIGLVIILGEIRGKLDG